MKWSWRIARIAGIDVYVHATFLILLAIVAAAPFYTTRSVPETLGQILFLLLLFAIVVLHELGHALTARHFGIQTRDIILLPIGGVARLERMPEDPKQELLVALAGPAVNVALAGVFFIALLPLGGLAHVGFSSLFTNGTLLLEKIVLINIALAVFNLIPAFPMDGGRVLRALLAMRLDYVRATRIAASVGQGMAFFLGFLGLMSSNVFMMLIALFVWVGAAEEASMVQVKSALSGIQIHRAMITEFHLLAPQDPLSKAVEYVLNGFQHDFPVADGDAVVGVLTRSDLMTALASEGLQGHVQDVMQRTFETAEPDEMLESVLARLQQCECRSLPVVRKGHLIGMVTLENIGEFMMVQTALHNNHIKPTGTA